MKFPIACIIPRGEAKEDLLFLKNQKLPLFFYLFKSCQIEQIYMVCDFIKPTIKLANLESPVII